MLGSFKIETSEYFIQILFYPIFYALKKIEYHSQYINLHSRFCSGGAANKINSRIVSAPYFPIISSGSIVLPFDFDILDPSLSTMP